MLVGYRNNEMRDVLRKVAGKHRAYLQEESDRVEGLEIEMGRITMHYRLFSLSEIKFIIN